MVHVMISLCGPVVVEVAYHSIQRLLSVLIEHMHIHVVAHYPCAISFQ